MKDNAIFVLGLLSVCLGVSLFFSVMFNFFQAIDISEYKGKEKVYKMQIHHYNPNDYLLQLRETRPN